jgi:hypothetical protein
MLFIIFLYKIIRNDRQKINNELAMQRIQERNLQKI